MKLKELLQINELKDEDILPQQTSNNENMQAEFGPDGLIITLFNGGNITSINYPKEASKLLPIHKKAIKELMASTKNGTKVNVGGEVIDFTKVESRPSDVSFVYDITKKNWSQKFNKTGEEQKKEGIVDKLNKIPSPSQFAKKAISPVN